MKKPHVLFLLIIVIIFTNFTYSLAQMGEYPSLEEIEEEHGYLNLNEEEIILLEEAELQQLIVEQDLDGFIEELSEDYEEEEASISNPLPLIKQFMQYFFQIMNRRSVYMLPDSIPAEKFGFTGTWDLSTENVTVKKNGVVIQLGFRIKFNGLINNLPKPAPMSADVVLTYHRKKERWKIKTSNGFFPFFVRCINKIQPHRKIPVQFEVFNKSKNNLQGGLSNENYK